MDLIGTPASARTPSDSPIEPTWQHMELVRRKLATLRQALLDTEEQFIVGVAREWNSGALTIHELKERYDAVMENGLPGHMERWLEAMPGLTPARIRGLCLDHHRANGNGGTWHGRWPMSQREQRPPRGRAVVYVLIDAEGVVCYVGSTNYFRKRLRDHEKAGKVWTRWQAHPCRSREEAYDMEQRFLDLHLPYLNKTRFARGIHGEAVYSAA